MKEEYLKLKRTFHIHLSLGIVLLALGISGVIAKQYPLGIIMIVIGLIEIVYGYFIIPKRKKDLERNMKEFCPICHKKIVTKKKEVHFYLNGVEIEEDKMLYDITGTKTKREILYYICLPCSFCLVEIHSYQFSSKKDWKEIKVQTNVDFDYHQQY